MPRQNRVSPFGSIEATAARGLLTGNRGILHDADGRLGAVRWRHPHWIACRLDFKGVRRSVMSPGTWTELFFLDEAVALAAGHRPCAYCSRSDFRRFAAAWQTAQALPQPPRAPAIDRELHFTRIRPRSHTQITFIAAANDLPDGSFLTLPSAKDEAWLVHRPFIRRWTFGGYDRSQLLPEVAVEVLTPAPTVAALRAGYRPFLHPSAG